MKRITQIAKEGWTIDQSINAERISVEELKLIFNQAEKRLDDTMKEGEGIASKTMSMITLIAGLLIGLSGYVISIWKGINASTDKDLVAVFGCLYLLCLLIYVISNVMTFRYSATGSKPENLINSAYIDEEIPRTKMLLLLYLNEIEEYDMRISNNAALNHRGWRRYRISVCLLLFFPMLLALLYEGLEWMRRAK